MLHLQIINTDNAIDHNNQIWGYRDNEFTHFTKKNTCSDGKGYLGNTDRDM